MYGDSSLVDSIIEAKVQAGHYREHPDLPGDSSMLLYFAACPHNAMGSNRGSYRHDSVVTHVSLRSWWIYRTVRRKRPAMRYHGSFRLRWMQLRRQPLWRCEFRRGTVWECQHRLKYLYRPVVYSLNIYIYINFHSLTCVGITH